MPARFSKYLYEVLVDVNTPKVGASESMQLYSLVVKKSYVYTLLDFNSAYGTWLENLEKEVHIKKHDL